MSIRPEHRTASRHSRRAIALAGFLLLATTAVAAPELSLAPVSAALGDTASIELRVAGLDEHLLGVNAKLKLPPGVALVGLEPGDMLTGAFELDWHDLEDGLGDCTVMAHSIAETTPATDGVLLRLLCQVTLDPTEAGLDQADEVAYDVPLVKSGLASIDGETSLPHTATAGRITISLSARPCLVVSPASRAVGAAPGNAVFGVSNTGGVDMPWTAQLVDGAGWATVTAGVSGLNAGTIQVTFTTNPAGMARTARILVDAGSVPGSPTEVAVTQAANTMPVLHVAPESVSRPAGSGVFDLAVSNLGFGTLSWSARVISGTDWLSIQAGASGEGPGMVALACAPNVTGTVRTAQVRVSAEDAAGSPASVTATQQAPPVLSVSPLTRNLTSAGGLATFDVHNAGSGDLAWAADITSGAEWLTIASGATGTQGGVVGVLCAEQTDGASRSGTLRITAPGAVGSPVTLNIVQAGSSTPFLSVSPPAQTVPATAEMAEYAVTNLGNGSLVWTAEVVEGSAWAAIEAGAAGTGTGVVRLRLLASMSPDERHATLRVAALDADNSPVDILLTQRGRAPLTVTYPNGGEWLRRGEACEVTWDVAEESTVASVSVLLLKGGNLFSTVSVTATNSGSYCWVIPPDTVPGDDYAVQLVDVNNSAIHDESDGHFAISCPPEVPEPLTAGTDRRLFVQLSWPACDAATDYRLYRAREDDPASAKPLATVAGTSYRDWDVDMPRRRMAGCSPQVVPARYHYWVTARNDCAESEFSESASGHATGATKAADAMEVWEVVLPSADDGGVSLLPVGSPVSIRLRDTPPASTGKRSGSMWMARPPTKCARWNGLPPGMMPTLTGGR